jgi:glucokinase
MTNSISIQDFSTMSTSINEAHVDDELSIQGAFESNFKKSAAALVLGTTLGLIQGVCLDSADNTRTAQV